jgi:hypothetical protein
MRRNLTFRRVQCGFEISRVYFFWVIFVIFLKIEAMKCAITCVTETFKRWMRQSINKWPTYTVFVARFAVYSEVPISLSSVLGLWSCPQWRRSASHIFVLFIIVMGKIPGNRLMCRICPVCMLRDEGPALLISANSLNYREVVPFLVNG